MHCNLFRGAILWQGTMDTKSPLIQCGIKFSPIRRRALLESWDEFSYGDLGVQRSIPRHGLLWLAKSPAITPLSSPTPAVFFHITVLPRALSGALMGQGTHYHKRMCRRKSIEGEAISTESQSKIIGEKSWGKYSPGCLISGIVWTIWVHIVVKGPQKFQEDISADEVGWGA